MRPTYETAADRKASAELAEAYALHRGLELVRYPDYSACDWALLDGDLIATMFECKTCDKPFGHYPRWITGKAKLNKLRDFRKHLKCDVFYVVRWSCGTIAAVPVDNDDGDVENWGRTDRGDRDDREPGVVFEYRRMLVIGDDRPREPAAGTGAPQARARGISPR